MILRSGVYRSRAFGAFQFPTLSELTRKKFCVMVKLRGTLAKFSGKMVGLTHGTHFLLSIYCHQDTKIKLAF